MKQEVKSKDILFKKHAGCRGGKGGCSSLDNIEWIKLPNSKTPQIFKFN